MSELSTAEYQGLLEIAEAALTADHPRDWWQRAGELSLGVLFHADVFSVAEIDHRHLAGRFGTIQPSWAEASVPAGSPMHRALLADHPFTAHLRGPHGQQVARITDLMSPLAWRNTAGYDKMRELINATHQLSISIVLDGSRSLSMSPIRSGSDFTDHEVLVARRLQPVLRAADRHVSAIYGQRGQLSTAEHQTALDAATEFNLTAREHLVLRFMARGLSTQKIAKALSISTRTVHKHQENLYRKMQVTDRLAAVLRGQQAGLLSPATSPPADQEPEPHGPGT